jgi:hypothetical protein
MATADPKAVRPASLGASFISPARIAGISIPECSIVRNYPKKRPPACAYAEGRQPSGGVFFRLGADERLAESRESTFGRSACSKQILFLHRTAGDVLPPPKLLTRFKTKKSPPVFTSERTIRPAFD